MAFSIQRAVSDGTMTLLPISIEYFDREEISVLFDGVLNARQWAWVGTTDKTLSFTPPVANTVEVMVARSTDLSELRHQFSLGAQFTAESLDESLLQVLHIAQEATERQLGGDFFTGINMHGLQITNLGAATAPDHAVTLAQYKADASGASAAKDTAVAASNSASASASAALISANNADVSEFNALSSASSASASASTASTKATEAAASTAAALISENAAELAESNAKASEVAAAASAAAALAYENKANEWAEKTSGPVEGSEYSAKYWAEQAAASTSGQFYEGSNTVTVNKTIVNGKNAMTPGPITVANGPSVVVESGAVWTIV